MKKFQRYPSLMMMKETSGMIPNIGNQCGQKRKHYHAVQMMKILMMRLMPQIKMMETLPVSNGTCKTW